MSNKFMSKVKALCKKAKDSLEAKTAVMKVTEVKSDNPDIKAIEDTIT